MTCTRRIPILICMAALTLIYACKSRQPNSDLEHTANQPVRGTEAWQWLEVTEAEYHQAIAPYLKLPSKENFISQFQNSADPASEMTIRMQYWLTNLHHLLKASYPDQLKNVPTPKAIIVRNDDANAFVSPVPVCLDVPVRLNPEIPITAANTLNRISFTTDGEFTDDASSGKDPICVHRKFPREYLVDMVKWFDAKSDGCTVKFEMDPTTHVEEFILSKNCPLDPELEDVAIAKSIVVVTTSNWVTINTGLINQMKDDEWMVLPTIVHELGHYYRSHLTVFPKEYNYFYQMPSTPVAHKPAPDPALKDFGVKVYEHAKILGLQTVDHQIYHTGLYSAITEMVHRFCKRNADACSRSVSCKELNGILEDGSLSDDLGNFPDEAIPDGKESAYKKFEQLASTCSQNIKLATNRTVGALTYSDIAIVLKHNDLSTVLTVPTNKANLQALLAALQGQMAQAARNADAVIKSAEERKVVRYTIEMEADEFGLEQFVKLGREPNDWLDADFVFNNDPSEKTVKPTFNSAGGNYRGNVDNKTCEKAYHDGWKFSGRPFIPDRGGFYDPHPNNCFRTYDMGQEIIAHKYVKRNVTFPTPPGKPWKDLAKLAAAKPTAESVASAPKTRARLAPHFRGCPLLMPKTEPTSL